MDFSGEKKCRLPSIMDLNSTPFSVIVASGETSSAKTALTPSSPFCSTSPSNPPPSPTPPPTPTPTPPTPSTQRLDLCAPCTKVEPLCVKKLLLLLIFERPLPKADPNEKA